jgi:hypothetical protein
MASVPSKLKVAGSIPAGVASKINDLTNHHPHHFQIRPTLQLSLQLLQGWRSNVGALHLGLCRSHVVVQDMGVVAHGGVDAGVTERFLDPGEVAGLAQQALCSLRLALTEYVAHYHTERNHQGKDNVLLFARDTQTRRGGPVQCRERLGGLLHYYHQEAA